MSVPPVFGSWRREVIADDVRVARLFLALRSPVLGAADYYAASVAGAVLGSGRGCRLYRRLVRERQVASSVSAFTFDLAKGSDLLIIDATARPDVPGETLESRVGEILDDFSAHGANAEEVARAIALITTDMVSSLQSAQSRADRLSQFATYFGDPALLNAQVDRFKAVTADEVSRFARERLGRENRASLLYVPRSSTGEDTSDGQVAATSSGEVQR